MLAIIAHIIGTIALGIDDVRLNIKFDLHRVELTAFNLCLKDILLSFSNWSSIIFVESENS